MHRSSEAHHHSIYHTILIMFQSKMKKRKTGRDESVNGNDGDDEGFESSPEKVSKKGKKYAEQRCKFIEKIKGMLEFDYLYPIN